MRTEDIISKSLDEDFKSFRKKLGLGIAGAGLATAGINSLPDKEPVSWEQSVIDDAEDMGIEVIFQKSGETDDIKPSGNSTNHDETSQWRSAVEDEAAKLGYEVEFVYGKQKAKSKASAKVASGKGSQIKRPKTRSIKDMKAPFGKTFIPRRETDWMALTMWAEARSHGEGGMRAVGHVIKNRAEANRPDQFGNGIRGVALHRKQFSCWNPGDPNRDAMLGILNLSRDSVEWKRFIQARRIAVEIVDGQSKDPTGGALFYHTTGVQPIWSVGLKPIKKFANHVFFKRTH